MDPEVKDMVAGAGVTAAAKLAFEAVFSYNAPKYNGQFPYWTPTADPKNIAIIIPPADVLITCLGTPLIAELLSRLKRRSPGLHAAAKGAALYGIPELLSVVAQRGMRYAHTNGVFGPPGVGQAEDDFMPQYPAPLNIQDTWPSSSPNVVRQVPYPVKPTQNKEAGLPWQRNMGW